MSSSELSVPAPQLTDRRHLDAEIERLAHEAHRLVKADIEPSSKRTYTSMQNSFIAFCTMFRLDPFTTGAAMLYVVHRKERGDAFSTLRSRLSAIRRLAQESNRDDPTKDPEIRKVLANAGVEIARTRSVRRVEPATYEILPKLVAASDRSADTDLVRLRDRALVLLGFALAWRGSELAALDVADMDRSVPGGVIFRRRSSKTNKSGEPEYIGVPAFAGDPMCPIAALETWLLAARINAGPVFRTYNPVRYKAKGHNRMRREDIARRLARIAELAGLPGFWRSHSLRRGFVTSGEQRGVARSRIRINTGWKSDTMFGTYADHKNKIAQSPLHEIYGRRVPGAIVVTDAGSVSGGRGL